MSCSVWDSHAPAVPELPLRALHDRRTGRGHLLADPHYESHRAEIRDHGDVRVVHYRDHHARPAVRYERHEARRGYRWRDGEWRWSRSEWVWTPGVYLRIR
jgi:hypothetical protein